MDKPEKEQLIELARISMLENLRKRQITNEQTQNSHDINTTTSSPSCFILSENVQEIYFNDENLERESILNKNC